MRYFALIVNDVDGSSSWYQAVLGLEELSRSTEEGSYDIINLVGPGVFVELLQLPHAGERPGGQTQGPFKVGMLVEATTIEDLWEIVRLADGLSMTPAM